MNTNPQNITRIVDLPDMNGSQGNFHSVTNNGEEKYDYQNPTYTPMNIHPNPYGNSLEPDVLPHPKKVSGPIGGVAENMPKYNSEDLEYLKSLPTSRLPTRDIPMDQTGYLNDEEIQPNFIPKPKITSDYVGNYETITEDKIRNKENRDKKMSFIDDLLSELQTPILIGVLYFFFQLPLVNTLIFKRFSFLTLYNSDGNINFYGIFVKSLFFGSIFYSIHKTIGFLSNF
jgi:hypothetical protein